QNTVPLIVTGPQVLSTQAVGSSGQTSTGSDNLLNDDKASQFKVTLDRPVKTSTFDASQVLSIMGPQRSITAPESFSAAVAQTIPASNSGISGSLDSTLSINSGGTLQIAHISVTLNIASQNDSSLTASLVAPDGTIIPLFAGLAGSGANFTNTVFDDSAANSITLGTAPFTGTFLPSYTLTSPRL